MKSKLSKAMYGKSMMKSGGAKKTVAKANSPKMKMGGATMKKSLAKKQAGGKAGGKAGPITEYDSKTLDDLYPSTTMVPIPNAPKNYMSYGTNNNDDATMEMKGRAMSEKNLRSSKNFNKDSVYKTGGATKKMQKGGTTNLDKAKYRRGAVSTTDGTYTKTGKKIGTGVGKKAEYRDFTTGSGDRSYAPTAAGMSEKMKLRQSNKKTTKQGNIEIKKMGGAKKPLAKAQKGKTVTPFQNYMKTPGAVASDTTQSFDVRRDATDNPKLDKAYYETYYAGQKDKRRTGNDKVKYDANGNRVYKTGGMVNSNAKVSAIKTAGSKGVKSGVNTKVTASKVAKGRVGGTSTAPRTATPKAKMGGMMKGKKC